jgi:hypothetical protein
MLGVRIWVPAAVSLFYLSAGAEVLCIAFRKLDANFSPGKTRREPPRSPVRQTEPAGTPARIG